jgi:putative protease
VGINIILIIKIYMVNNKTEEGKPIGKITHYFSRIGVAVIDLSGILKKGDTIRIVGGEDTDFTQTVESMEVEHEKVGTAKKGDAVGVKVNEKVREGYKVYKV